MSREGVIFLHMNLSALTVRSERAFIAVLAAALAATAWGGGAPFVRFDLQPAHASAQRAIVMDLGDGMETLVVSMTYSGPPGKFAWILPVPIVPGIGKTIYPEVAPASETFVRQLFTATAPKILTEPAKPTTAPLPEVVEPPGMHTAPYTVSVIPSTRIEALTSWLDSKGYRYDDAVEPLIDEYVGSEWCFVAVKTEAPAGTGAMVEGTLPPLAIRFPRPKNQPLIYPLMFSKAGARKAMVVEVVLITRTEMDCVEAPGDPLEHAREWRDRGLLQILGDATDKGTRAVALWQSRGVPVGPTAWCVAAKERPAQAKPWRELHCRRLWMKLRSDQLRDLHFGTRDRALLDFSTEFVRQAKERFVLVREGGTLYAAKRACMKALVDLGERAGATALLVTMVVVLGLVLGFAAVVYLRHFTVPPGAAILALALALAMVAGLRAYSSPEGDSGWKAWDQGTAVLDRGIRTFVDCFGAHPLRVEDLMSPHPAWGVDASGNSVDLTGAAKKLGEQWRPLTLKDLPADPATRSQHSWTIDPAAPRWLRSKALKTTVMIQSPTPAK